MIRAAAVLLLVTAGCTPPVTPSKPEPPFRACLTPPPGLPAIATVEHLRARHDQLDRLYLDCAARLRRNLEAAS